MSGPLDGVQIVELAGVGPAPFGVMLLSDLGADVVRIDRPTAEARSRASLLSGISRGRRSIALDLKRTEAASVVRELARRSDVLVEGYRPGVMERLGLGPEVCCGVNPRLIYARMTGWGQDGPWATKAGHDIGYIALAGALYNIGRQDSPPPPPQAYVGDFGGGGTFLAIGILAALVERASSGVGQVIDASVFDGASLLTAFSHGLSQIGQWGGRGATLADGSVPYYDSYETADGGYMAVGAIEPKFYRELLDRLELVTDEFPQDDRAVWPRLRAALTAKFRSRTRDEWENHFDGADACVVPVLTLLEASRHPHSVARRGFVSVGDCLQPAPAPRLSRTPAAAGPPAPAVGEHTRDVLRELGWNDDRISALVGEANDGLID